MQADLLAALQLQDQSASTTKEDETQQKQEQPPKEAGINYRSNITFGSLTFFGHRPVRWVAGYDIHRSRVKWSTIPKGR